MLKTVHDHNPFSLIAHDSSRGFKSKVMRTMISPVSKVAGLDHCAAHYSEMPLSSRASNFADNALAKLGVG